MFGMDKDTVGLLIALITLIINSGMAIYMRELKTHVNGMKDALMASTKTSSHAEGKLEGKAEARQENIADAEIVAAVAATAAQPSIVDPNGHRVKSDKGLEAHAAKPVSKS